MPFMKFPHEIEDILKHYVYVYRDPDTGSVFYVGRGEKNRAYSHLHDDSDSRKVDVIRKLEDCGKFPIIDILRYGLTEDQARLVEASVLDLLGVKQLTNKARGSHDGSFGRTSAEELIATEMAEPCLVTHKALLIRINKLYRTDMSDEELYEATRGIWKIGPRRNSIDYALAVYCGIVHEVYKIESWHQGGSTAYATREEEIRERKLQGQLHGRYEFIGKPAIDQTLRQYIGKSVKSYFKKGNQNPIVYVNI